MDQFDPAAKIQDMDAHGIDVSVLSVTTPGPEVLQPELGVEAVRVCADYLAELCGRFPGQFVAGRKIRGENACRLFRIE